jgi:hypothetical protein
MLDNGLMDFLTEKGMYIFQMDAFFKDGSIKVKLKDKTIYLFTQTDLFIEDRLNTLKKMGSENFIITMDFSIQVFGSMEFLMVLMGFKFILMEVNMLEIL